MKLFIIFFLLMLIIFLQFLSMVFNKRIHEGCAETLKEMNEHYNTMIFKEINNRFTNDRVRDFQKIVETQVELIHKHNEELHKEYREKQSQKKLKKKN